MLHEVKEGVRAEFNKDRNGRLLITFFDPSYVRADAIIIDRKDLSVHAVMHEGSHYIGPIRSDLASNLDKEKEVFLSAIHYNGMPIGMKTQLIVHK